MFLRALQLNVSSAAVIPSDFDALAFSASNRAVVSAYEDSLPKRSVVLGEAKKVNVQLGPRPVAGIFAHADFGIYPDGIGWIWMPDFNFGALVQASDEARQMLLLDALHHGIIELAREMNSDLTPFEDARTCVAHMIPLAETRKT